jgi:hypothetical protein
MFRENTQLTREENIKLAEESSAKAKELYDKIIAAVAEGFKHVPKYGSTKAQGVKFASPVEVISRLEYESRAAYNLKSTYNMRDRMAKEAADKEEAIKTKAKLDEERSVLLGEAIQYLIEKGLKINTDFTITNAIEKANNVAFELECQRKEDSACGDYVDFSGQNCEDECNGWNPGERRCQCGNRRVSWVESYGHSFKDPSVYAEAW